MYSSSFCLSRTIPISPLPFKCSERMLYNCLSHLKYFGIIFEIIPTSNLKNNKSDVLQCANACRSELVKMLSLLLPLVVRASPLFYNSYAQGIAFGQYIYLVDSFLLTYMPKRANMLDQFDIKTTEINLYFFYNL